MSTNKYITSFVRRKAISYHPKPQYRRAFHVSRTCSAVKPFLLADIGEGITECQLIQWFVQPGARVEQFDKLCEVQSDKASVEITSPFDGVIKRLHYEPDDMAITGRPLVDIDIQDDLKIDASVDSVGVDAVEVDSIAKPQEASVFQDVVSSASAPTQTIDSRECAELELSSRPNYKETLATPAVRHLLKSMNIDIAQVRGSGKDGRVTKDDVQRHTTSQSDQSLSKVASTTAAQADRKIPLTAVQNAMFKVMTRSLRIPHFLYTSSADLSAITALRKSWNASAESGTKLTHLAFIMKAISLAFLRHPLMNATLDVTSAEKPLLTYRGTHDFGIAVDTPAGLLVPVIRDVQNMSVLEIARKMQEVSHAARTGQLTPSDFCGASFTVSNIGSIGGGVVSPIISEPQVAIVGIGRSKIVPAFDEQGAVVRKEELVFSWSADHRVLDGAECARCAERVKNFLEDPNSMLVELR